MARRSGRLALGPSLVPTSPTQRRGRGACDWRPPSLPPIATTSLQQFYSISYSRLLQHFGRAGGVRGAMGEPAAPRSRWRPTRRLRTTRRSRFDIQPAHYPLPRELRFSKTSLPWHLVTGKRSRGALNLREHCVCTAQSERGQSCVRIVSFWCFLSGSNVFVPTRVARTYGESKDATGLRQVCDSLRQVCARFARAFRC